MYRLVLLGIILLLFCNCKQSSKDIYAKNYELLTGQETTLNTLGQKDFTIFIAYANNCPLCKAAIPTLQIIADSYPNVGLVLFYPANQRDSQINKFITSLLPNGVIQIKDKNKYLTHFFKADVTPQVFILNRAGVIVYRGAVDNRMENNWRKSYGSNRPILLNALDTLVNFNQPLKQNEVKAIGCYIE